MKNIYDGITILDANGEANVELPAWFEAGLYVSDDPQFGAFLGHFEMATWRCWPDLVQKVRKRYPEYKEQLLVPIWDTGEKMLRLNLIRALASDREDEVKLFQPIVQRPSIYDNGWELQTPMRVAKRRGLAVE